MFTRYFWLAAASSLSFTAASKLAQADTSKLEEVMVTASPIKHGGDEFATIVDSVDRSQILRQGGANLADALATEPGISGSGFAAGASRPVIRGFDANRVRLLEDGIGSFDVSDVGPDHGVPIDPLAAQRVEVVRGAATVRYGSQAIGGVVNAINNRVPSTLPQESLSGEVTAGYGSSAHSGDGSALIDGRLGQFAIHADGFARHTSDYRIPDGKQPNSWFRGDGYSLGSSYFFGDSRVGAAVVHYDSKYGIPSDDTFIDMRQTKAMTRNSFAVDQGALQTLNVDGGYADYEHAERDPETGEALSTFKDREWDARAESIFGEVGPLSGAALGVQLQQRDFSALGEGSNYLLPTTTRTGALFGFAEIPLNAQTHLETGARIERLSIDGTPATDVSTSRTFTPVSASLGAVMEVNPQVRLGLTLSSAARAPAQTELFARGAHDGPGTYETGDPSLGIERATSLEASLRLRFARSRIDTSVWTTRFDHYIHGQLTGRTCDDDGACVDDDSQELRELHYIAENATFSGAETRADFTLMQQGSSTLQAQVFGDYVRARTTSGESLPLIPPWHAGGRLQWLAPRWDASVMVKYTAARNDVSRNETPTAGFTSVNADVALRPFNRYDGVEIALAGSNLTNTTQRNAVALNKDQVVMPGRDVRLLLRVSF